MRQLGSRLLLFSLALVVLVSAASWSKAADIRLPSGQDWSWQVATGVAGLFAMAIVVAACAGEPVPLRVLPRRLVNFAGVVLLLALIMFATGAIAFLLQLAAGVLGTVVGGWAFLWVMARTIFAPAETLLSGRGPVEAVTSSWNRSRGLAFFIGGALLAMGFVALPLFSVADHMPSWWRFFGTAATQAATQSVLVIVFWRWAQDARDAPTVSHDLPGSAAPTSAKSSEVAPARLVANAPGPDDAVLVRLRTSNDLLAIRSKMAEGPVWAVVETRDQRLMADAVQEGVQVLVLDQRARLALGLTRPTSGMASMESDGIHWHGHRYVPLGDVWTLEPMPRPTA